MLFDPRILLLSSDEAETSVWEEILREHAILKSVKNLSELQSTLEGDSYDAMFCGWSFHQGSWQEALEQIQQRCPSLPVIVFGNYPLTTSRESDTLFAWQN